MTKFGVQSFSAHCLTVCKGVITACFILKAVNQIWPTSDVKRHSKQIRDLNDNHMAAPAPLHSFWHKIGFFTARNDEHFTIALYNWIPPFLMEGSPIHPFALFFNFNLSRNKSTQYKQSSKYMWWLTLSLASAVQCPQFVCFSDLWVPSFSRALEGQPWGNSASRSRAREAALRANCALHPLSCSFYPLFALSLQKKDT